MLHAAYCDSQGVTEAFIKNGMSHALAALGCHEGRSPDAWKYDVVVNPKTRQVSFLHAYLDPPNCQWHADGTAVAQRGRAGPHQRLSRRERGHHLCRSGQPHHCQ